MQVKARQKEAQTSELEIRKSRRSVIRVCDPDGTEQMEADLEAATQEIVEATSAQDKTKAELAALEETMKIQQVCALIVLFTQITQS
jgi:hypothetical protein